jgi:hypothetical protein
VRSEEQGGTRRNEDERGGTRREVRGSRKEGEGEEEGPKGSIKKKLPLQTSHEGIVPKCLLTTYLA